MKQTLLTNIGDTILPELKLHIFHFSNRSGGIEERLSAEILDMSMVLARWRNVDCSNF